jgi:hypothetical protein
MSKLKDQRRASSTVSNLQFSKSITQLSKIKNAVILIQNTLDDDYQMRTESHKPEKYLQLLSFPLFSRTPRSFCLPISLHSLRPIRRDIIKSILQYNIVLRLRTKESNHRRYYI